MHYILEINLFLNNIYHSISKIYPPFVYMIEKPRDIPESRLGIEYECSVSEVFVPVMIQGEREWLENASDTYGDDA